MTKTAADFPTLHVRRLDGRGYPDLRPDLLTFLDRAPRAGATVLTLQAARAKLATDHPDLSACVEAWCVAQQDMRTIAAAIGVSLRTVHVRAHQGLARLAAWCGSDPERIAVALRHGIEP